jgi:hypothetical protein
LSQGNTCELQTELFMSCYLRDSKEIHLTNSYNIVARICADYIRRSFGLTTGFIGSHTITVYPLYNSLQFTITLAESSHCIFTRCLSSNITGSVRLQLCNSSLKTAAWPDYHELVTAELPTNSRLTLPSLTNWLQSP